MSIADNIKHLREKYGLTQAELGEIAGVSDKAVWTWENGTAEPRMGAVQKIAEHFGVSKGSIVDDTQSVSVLSSSEESLVACFRQLNEEGQEKLREYAMDLTASGRYIKNNESDLVGKKEA